MSLSIDDALMEQLASASGKSRERAFAELIRLHASSLTRILGATLLERTDVDDVVQETFFRVYQARDRYVAGGQASFRTWLVRIARNAALDVRRRRAVRAAEPLEESEPVADPGPGPVQALLDEGRADRVRRALDALPEADREVIVLRFDEEMSYAQIAELTGNSEAAVKQRALRARQRLKALLSKERA